MTWTTPGGIRNQVKRLWDRGVILRELIDGESAFPYRVALKKPTPKDWVDRFSEVRAWIAALDAGQSAGYRIEWRTVNHRVIGVNKVPNAVWIDTFADAVRLIDKQNDVRRFRTLAKEAASRLPGLTPWLAKDPTRVLVFRHAWPRLLGIAEWVRDHPRPGVYLRQVDVPGVHTKFIEQHRAVLTEWLDLLLDPSDVCTDGTTAAQFARRYGFRTKPVRVRFRVLDPAIRVLPAGANHDIAVPHDTFAALHLPVERVFITENEINFLAFPEVPQSIVLFGAGYGFDQLAEATWLHDADLLYWGDIDTHGFAILDQLRGHFPQATSLLMDRQTLFAHRDHWTEEPRQETRDLPRLTAPEAALYDDLRHNRLAPKLRLEQERIAYAKVEQAIAALREAT